MDNCHSAATCEDTHGSFVCMCNPGYQGDGQECDDVDECLSVNNCSTNAECANTAGGYTCTCNAGFSGDGQTCTGGLQFIRHLYCAA